MLLCGIGILFHHGILPAADVLLGSAKCVQVWEKDATPAVDVDIICCHACNGLAAHLLFTA